MKLSTILVLKIAVDQNGKFFLKSLYKTECIGSIHATETVSNAVRSDVSVVYSYVHVNVVSIELWVLKGYHHGCFLYFYFHAEEKTHAHTHTHNNYYLFLTDCKIRLKFFKREINHYNSSLTLVQASTGVVYPNWY